MSQGERGGLKLQLKHVLWKGKSMYCCEGGIGAARSTYHSKKGGRKRGGERVTVNLLVQKKESDSDEKEKKREHRGIHSCIL